MEGGEWREAQCFTYLPHEHIDAAATRGRWDARKDDHQSREAVDQLGSLSDDSSVCAVTRATTLLTTSHPCPRRCKYLWNESDARVRATRYTPRERVAESAPRAFNAPDQTALFRLVCDCCRSIAVILSLRHGDQLIRLGVFHVFFLVHSHLDPLLLPKDAFYRQTYHAIVNAAPPQLTFDLFWAPFRLPPLGPRKHDGVFFIIDQVHILEPIHNIPDDTREHLALVIQRHITL